VYFRVINHTAQGRTRYHPYNDKQWGAEIVLRQVQSVWRFIKDFCYSDVTWTAKESKDRREGRRIGH